MQDATDALRRARDAWRDGREHQDAAAFPSRGSLADAVETLSGALYPRRLGRFRGGAAEEDAFVAARLGAAFTALEREIAAEPGYWRGEAGHDFDPDHAGTIVRLFAATLGEVRRLVDSDVEAAFLADPAARSVDEVLVCYPGAIAALHHRVAHQLDALGAPIVARVISELANERTGVDIHPGATIGDAFFIDHGTGVVIGETAIIGKRVRLYQHVTLGAISFATRRTACEDIFDRPGRDRRRAVVVGLRQARRGQRRGCLERGGAERRDTDRHQRHRRQRWRFQQRGPVDGGHQPGRQRHRAGRQHAIVSVRAAWRLAVGPNFYSG